MPELRQTIAADAACCLLPTEIAISRLTLCGSPSMMREIGLCYEKYSNALQLQPADRHRGIVKGTVEAISLLRLDNHPADRAARGKGKKIGRLVAIPSLRELLLALPFRSHLRKDRSDPTVLCPVREHAALGDGAEAMHVFAGKYQISGRESEDSILRRVVIHPLKRLHPRIAG